MHDRAIEQPAKTGRRLRLGAGAITLAALLSGGAILYTVDPSKAWWMPVCFFHKLTGFYCPGCGSGRALHQLVHGNLAAAWRLNPLMVLTIPLLVYLIAGSCLAPRPGARPAQVPTWLPWILVVVIVAFWVLRNIPVYPFTLLAPH